MSNIAEILEAPDGMPVVGLVATVSKAFDIRKPTTQYGDQQVMDMELSDATGTMKASWWNPTLAPAAIRGKTLTFSAALNGKKVMAGVTKKTRPDKNGNPRAELTITGAHAHLPGETKPQTTAKVTQAQPAQSRAVNPTPGTLPLTEYLGLLRVAHKYVRDVMEVADEQAQIAFTNTVGIALTNGRIAVDSDGKWLEFQDDNWPDEPRVVPIPEDEPPSDHDDDVPDPTDDDIPY